VAQQTSTSKTQNSGQFDETPNRKVDTETQTAGSGGIKTPAGKRPEGKGTADDTGLTTGDDMGTASDTGESAP